MKEELQYNTCPEFPYFGAKYEGDVEMAKKWIEETKLKYS